MTIIIAGLLLWSVVHLIPSIAQPLKNAWVGKMGENGYKATFSLLIALSLVLIVYGWRHTTPDFIYAPIPEARPFAVGLLILAFVMMGAANYPSRIKCVIRHPQLTGVIVWSVAHLILNGDSRSLLLFGGLGVWALLEIFLINRREGAWQKPVVPSLGRELRGAAISLIIFAVVVFIHPYIAGVPVNF